MKTKIALMAALIVAGFAHQASAAVHGLSVSQMLSQTVESSDKYTFISGWTAAPFYGDGVQMKGAAGVSDNLGINGYVYFELTPTDLSDFLADTVDGDKYSMRVWNDDNNDPWVAGIWFDTASGRVENAVLEQPDPFSSVVSLTMADVSEITALGVFILNPNEQGDTYHVSFLGVPEPGTMAIWTVLGGLGLVMSRRRKG